MKTTLPAALDAELYELVRQIPAGSVATYGQLARLLGVPNHARLVGRLLSRAPEGVPCHRVVSASGATVASWAEQRRLLAQEGVCVRPDGRVDLRRLRWNPSRWSNGAAERRAGGERRGTTGNDGAPMPRPGRTARTTRPGQSGPAQPEQPRRPGPDAEALRTSIRGRDTDSARGGQ